MAESMAAVAAASVVWRLRGRNLLKVAVLVMVTASLLWAAQPAAANYRAELSPLTHTTTITYVRWVTRTETVTVTQTLTTTMVLTYTTTIAIPEYHYYYTYVTSTEYRTTYVTSGYVLYTVTQTVHPCHCRGFWSCWMPC